MAAGGGMVYWKKWIRLRDAKKDTIKAFWWFKGDLIAQWISKFYLCDESNPINPQCGKISANFYISLPHPPHPQFYPQKWWKFWYTSWLTKKIASRGAQVIKSPRYWLAGIPLIQYTLGIYTMVAPATIVSMAAVKKAQQNVFALYHSYNRTILLGFTWILNFHFKIVLVLRRRYLIPIRCNNGKR